MLSDENFRKIKDKMVLVVGCGGLGGYVVEHLVRIGVGKIVVADDDCFCKSNLNRQLMSTLQNNGLNKAKEAKKRAAIINDSVEVAAVTERVHKANIEKIALGCDLVFDCCDNISTRLTLEEYCEKNKTVLIHGAINDLCGQVATIYPGDKTISKLYGEKVSKRLSTLSFVPAIVASFQVSEGIKTLLGCKNTLKGKVMVLDLLTNDIKIL
ncbi:MAG: HesA/MoeB/ThiF family protein [Bacillota bacterium]